MRLSSSLGEAHKSFENSQKDPVQPGGIKNWERIKYLSRGLKDKYKLGQGGDGGEVRGLPNRGSCIARPQVTPPSARAQMVLKYSEKKPELGSPHRMHLCLPCLYLP